MTESILKIGQLAKELGTTTKTLRFYEEIGLLTSSIRSDAGYRLYNGKALSEARVLIGLRRLGLSIDEMQRLCSSKPDGPMRKQLLSILDEKVRDVDISLSVLQGKRDDMEARFQALMSTPSDRPDDCVCDALLIPCDCVPKAGADG